MVFVRGWGGVVLFEGVGGGFCFYLYITVTATNQVENITHATDRRHPGNSWQTSTKTGYGSWFLFSSLLPDTGI